MDAHTTFSLGRIFDLAQGKRTDQPLTYDPADLTTHAFVTGMTGSGKTGLCITLMEEAALAGIPAIIVDPKGDLTNLLLHFPGLAPADFKPWLDADAARRAGKPLDVAAQEVAETWKNGLAEWGLGPQQVAELQAAARFSIYTPGSDAGLPVSILASLKAPSIPWEGNREVLREKISSTVTALLGLIGYNNIDPVRSREHILLANIFEAAWSQGKDLDLAELIMQTQTPPFTRLGVFPVENFFPEKDRFDLAMLLNNFLAAPAFETWLEGQPLDIPALLYTPEGKPRHSIFYVAHLSDTERMFFVTLLFSAVETWMRTQSGSSSLRALLYFDEIVGYLPPVANPPSKPILLRMLKQARAFGVGLLLATQNPVDIDYKALSNAGTWLIGKLQTDQDKQRLLDGLAGAATDMDRSVYDRLISGLGKRVFLLHNVHLSKPVIFQTRWTMNYLAGPLTRMQIPALNQLAKQTPGSAALTSQPLSSAVTQPIRTAAAAQAVSSAAAGPSRAGTAGPAAASNTAPAGPAPLGSTTRPAVPAATSEYFLPVSRSLAEALLAEGKTVPAGTPPAVYLYRPALLAQARVRYLQRKYNIDQEQVRTILVQALDRRGVVRWEDFQAAAQDPQQVQLNGLADARYAGLESPLGDGKVLTAMQKDFLDWAYRTSQLRLRANEGLDVYSGPDVTTAAFRDLCSQAARSGRDAEMEKALAGFDTKLAALKDKMAREQRELQQQESQLSQRKMEEFGTGVENVIGLFTGSKRRISSSLTKRRMTEQARMNLDESKASLATMAQQVNDLQKARQQAEQDVNDRWAGLVERVTEIPLTPARKDVYIELFGVAWLPFYVLNVNGQNIEVPAY